MVCPVLFSVAGPLHSADHRSWEAPVVVSEFIYVVHRISFIPDTAINGIKREVEREENAKNLMQCSIASFTFKHRATLKIRSQK
jgi:hypothetical protein